MCIKPLGFALATAVGDYENIGGALFTKETSEPLAEKGLIVGEWRKGYKRTLSALRNGKISK